jgi:hypothetical protein
MMNKKITVFVLDDSIPTIPDYIDRGVYSRSIKQDELLHLAQYGDWKGEGSLQRLTLDLLNHEYIKTGKLEIYGYTHPEICLSESDRNPKPDVVIYDWEYGTNSYTQSGEWLLDILHMTNAFVFVYSLVRNEVPPTLNKKVFDEFAKRFQLFSKGNTDNSVFTSEDFLYQYILSLVNKDNTIKVQGMNVKFEANGYLKKPTDILYLESILGRESLLAQIKNNQNEISEETIERIIDSLNGRILLNREKGFLITSDSSLFKEKFKPNEEMSYLNALKEFGIIKLKEALEAGLARV